MERGRRRSSDEVKSLSGWRVDHIFWLEGVLQGTHCLWRDFSASKASSVASNYPVFLITTRPCAISPYELGSWVVDHVKGAHVPVEVKALKRKCWCCAPSLCCAYTLGKLLCNQLPFWLWYNISVQSHYCFYRSTKKRLGDGLGENTLVWNVLDCYCFYIFVSSTQHAPSSYLLPKLEKGHYQ